ncbi:MAG: DUF4252 domain-containing protein [Terriglobia bacterium]
MKTPMGFTSRQTRWARASLVTGFLLVCLGTNAYSQDAKLNLNRLDNLASRASNVVNVNLEGPLLKLAAAAMGARNDAGKQPAERSMLQQLKGIYVRSYEFDEPGEYSRSDVENVLKQLRSGGWTSIVNVDEKKKGAAATTTNVYVMNDGGEVVGLAVVAAEPKELTVVNLVGPIDFAQLGSLGQLGQLGKLGKLFAVPGSLQHRGQPQNGAARSAH